MFVDETNAQALALEAGSGKAVNIVLMGRLARHFDIKRFHSIPQCFIYLTRFFISFHRKSRYQAFSLDTAILYIPYAP
ncbi:MAG: hypothetical protein K2J77_07285 [Oscillospiraceae bacterium]|nr:hypothetical protein [Oscillospiraceae bacterium]